MIFHFYIYLLANYRYLAKHARERAKFEGQKFIAIIIKYGSQYLKVGIDKENYGFPETCAPAKTTF